MSERYQIKVIARMHSLFPTKFGIPRQSGVVESLQAEIVFEPEFRSREAVRGLDGYSHIWLIWQFSQAVRDDWSPTVRPPRLGGNTRMGVFATRSPFRPNNLGLSSVRLLGVEQTREFGTVLHVGGADLMDGTPILDIKPYLPFTDSHPQATGGFTDGLHLQPLKVVIPEDLKQTIPADQLDALTGVLEQDPRPSYQDDPQRVYGFFFGNLEISFTVCEGTLTVCKVEVKR